MFRNVHVDGFRSLIDFQIALKEGLNVVVGPNGTGKSNFISFLDFVGELVTSGLNAAIATTHGAGSVFSQEKFSSDAAELTFVITGEVSTARVSERWFWAHPDTEHETVEYAYECRLRYDRSLPAVYVAYEHIRLRADTIPEVSVERFTERTLDKFSNAVRFTPADCDFINGLFRWQRRDTSDFDLSDYIAKSVTSDMSIIQRFIGEHPAFATIALDISSYRSINIEPSLARKPSPVGTTTQIQPTGEGLAAVLYGLERGTYYPSGKSSILDRSRPSDEQKRNFSSIMSWCREVNPHVRRAEVQLDFHEAQLRPVMLFSFPGGVSEFPFRRVSDGTVKWLALVTILFSEDRLAVIEEPENFLHPFMQETFVALCRQVITNEPHRSLIISTHSPTILDCCDPSELSIFELNDGRTSASSVENAAELNATIAKSRFGLGYFYRTGGVYGTDSRAR